MAQPTTLYLLHARFTRSTPQNFLSRSPVPVFMIVATAFAVIAVFVRLSWSAKFLVAPSPPISFPSFQFTPVPLGRYYLMDPFQSHCGSKFPAHLFNLRICSISISFFLHLHLSLFTSQSQGIFLQLDNLLHISISFLNLYHHFHINQHSRRIRSCVLFRTLSSFSLYIYRVIFLSELAQPCNCGSSG